MTWIKRRLDKQRLNLELTASYNAMVAHKPGWKTLVKTAFEHYQASIDEGCQLLVRSQGKVAQYVLDASREVLDQEQTQLNELQEIFCGGAPRTKRRTACPRCPDTDPARSGSGNTASAVALNVSWARCCCHAFNVQHFATI